MQSNYTIGIDWAEGDGMVIPAVCQCGEIAGPVGLCHECLVERLGEDEGRCDYDAAGQDE